jgi:uncharacterized protein YecE (DUF72 family)
MNWWIGCSGFSYYHWKEKFYPKSVPQKMWLEYYCQFFNTVELNVTFYRMPALNVFKSWKERSPDDFKYTVKAPRLITHYDRFNNSKESALLFYDRVINGLEEKLGTVLFQLHPQMEFSEELLEKIISTLDPAFKNVIEFRHSSWWNQEVYNTLKKEKISFCGISYPRLPDEVICTNEILYYRLHGVPRLYRSDYSNEKLQMVFNEIKSSGAKEAFIYFNNDAEGHAINNALELNEIVKDVQ